MSNGCSSRARSTCYPQNLLRENLLHKTRDYYARRTWQEKRWSAVYLTPHASTYMLPHASTYMPSVMTLSERARDLRLWPGVHRAQEALVDIRTGDTMTDMNRDTVACLKGLVADLRTHVVGNRSAMGLCSDLAYFLYYFI